MLKPDDTQGCLAGAAHGHATPYFGVLSPSPTLSVEIIIFLTDHIRGLNSGLTDLLLGYIILVPIPHCLDYSSFIVSS